MTWRPTDPQGRESAKVRFDLVPYMNGRVLDLGCGQEKVYPIAVGVDNKIDMKLFGIEVKPDIPVDTCERMPIFADEIADTIFSSHMLEHVDYENVESTLREWFRILKPNGYLILYLPNNEDPVEKGGYPDIGQPGANPDHRWSVTYNRVIDALKGAGSWDLIRYEKRTEEMEYSLLFIARKLPNGTQEHSAD